MLGAIPGRAAAGFLWASVADGPAQRAPPRHGLAAVLAPAAAPRAGPLLLALLCTEHNEHSGEHGGDPLQKPEPLLDPGDILGGGVTGDSSASGVDVPGLAELRAKQPAVRGSARAAAESTVLTAVLTPTPDWLRTRSR